MRKNRKFRKQRYDFRKKKSKVFANYKKILVVFGLAMFFNILFFSDIFQIKNIEIDGNQGIKSDNMKNIINSELMEHHTGIIAGNNIFLANKREIEEKLLVEFSEIEELKIKKVFPKTLKVKILEKTPFVFWCRLNECYYLDNNGIAFATEEARYKDLDDKKFIKIIEELEIEEEITENKIKYIEEVDSGKEYNAIEFQKTEIENLLPEGQETKQKEKIILKKVNIYDQVSDRDFINFILEVDNGIKKINNLKIKYYKTKGTKTRQLIAYTDKNVRIYFSAMSSAELQVKYLKEFLAKAISKNEMSKIQYIRLESENKIFYK